MSYFRGVDDVLARKAGNVGAGTADVTPLDHCSFFPSGSHGPGDVLAGFTAAEHEKVVVFCLERSRWHRTSRNTSHALEDISNEIFRTPEPVAPLCVGGSGKFCGDNFLK